MNRKSILSLLLIICFAVNLIILPAYAAQVDAYDAVTVTKIISRTNLNELKSKSAILMEPKSANVLMEQNSHEKLPIASVTKIMSMLLIMEAIDEGRLGYDDIVTVSEHSYSMGGSQVWLKPGETFSVREMMYAVAIGSANDCTVALAEHIAGSEEAFVAMMNEKAKALGMVNTNFLDCTGLTDEGHYSTAYDIALMSRELLVKHPKVIEFTGQWNKKFREGAAKGEIGLYNTNKLIRFYEGATGLKTGFTNAARYCLSASAERNGLQLIAVVLGAPDSNTRFAEVQKLLNYGFANYEVAKINSKGDGIGEVMVKKGLDTKVNAVLDGDVNLVVAKGGKDSIAKEVKLPENVNAPVEKGQKLGEVIFSVEGKELGKFDVVAEGKVEKASFLRLFFKLIVAWFGMGR
ncbi:MAG: D-alanyl-D-alanine carboxypeptidase [Clostridia bacterium]|nr:D-alanyl-D-alanine carboxypeptidase [Clostridia bacterium]